MVLKAYIKSFITELEELFINSFRTLFYMIYKECVWFYMYILYESL